VDLKKAILLALGRLSVMVLGLFWGTPLYATHIYGGDLTYQHLGNNQYTVRLVVYRDCGPTNVNGTDFDSEVYIGVFDFQNNLYDVLTVPLTANSTTLLPSQLENPCFTIPPNVCVEQAIYLTNVTLPFDPNGYTLSYQRCCRNTSIDNIVQNANSLAGMTLTTQIPGTNLVSVQNSSPTFNSVPPTSLCLNAPFYYSAAATDVDGDQLVYSFCNPLNGGTQNTPAPNPPDSPPYNSIAWSAGFSAGNPITANPAFSINSATGYITGTATQLGTYALAICVAEYRNGILINTIRRDYQINVNMCNPNTGAQVAVSNAPGGQQVDFCAGLEVPFINNSFNSASYHWDFGVPTIEDDTSNAFEPVYTYDVPGIYTVTLVTNPGWECADTASILYTAIQTFVPNISTLSIDCINGEVAYDLDHGLDAAQFPALLNFQWDFPAGTSPSSSDVAMPQDVIFPESSSNYDITLTIDNEGCVGTQTVNIVNDPEPSAVIADQTAFCEGLTYNFINNSADAISYWWEFNSPAQGDFSNEINPSFTFPDTGLYLVQLIAYGTNACPDTAWAPIHIFGNLAPTFNEQIPQCLSTNSFDFVAQGATTNSATFQWSFPPEANLQNSVQESVNNIEFNGAGSFPVSITIQENGCTETYTADVWVVEDPTVLVTTDNAEGCPSLYTNFYATPNSETQVFYEWNFGDDGTSTNEDPTHVYTQSGWFDVTLHAYTISGCVADIYVNLNDAVNVHPVPQPGFVVNPMEVSIDNPVVNIIDSSQFASECVYYTSDGSTLPGFNVTYGFTQAGRQTITQVLTNEWGCTATTSGYVYIGGSVFFAPNSFTPNQDGVNDAWQPVATGIKTYEIQIYNRWGEIVFASNDIAKPWMGESMGTEYFVPDGIYNYVITYFDMLEKPTVLKGTINIQR
jgi:gliding motility-associated-like protein